MAKPMPAKDPEEEIRNVFDADQFAARVTKAPPEFPGLMAASVWMNSPGLRRSLASGLGRLSALMMRASP